MKHAREPMIISFSVVFLREMTSGATYLYSYSREKLFGKMNLEKFQPFRNRLFLLKRGMNIFESYRRGRL